ncbi:hypothetical protein [Cloacibacterium sp. TD35]|uniref:hypothetical protein n=1 Tax=Cloacibacterium sp. TD35 TaxID=2976818 RepID=UPI00237DA88D|nr:hypothetical protein [Cloacibacterium sp. TD35]WDT67133.1 hypothetical protein N7277_07270 [Cloacibacterium sp. TD35]
MKKVVIKFFYFFSLTMLLNCYSINKPTSNSFLEFNPTNGEVVNYKTTMNMVIKDRFIINDENYNKLINHLKDELKINIDNKDLVINYVFKNDPCRRNSADYSFIGEGNIKNIQVKNFEKIHPNLKFIFLIEEGRNFHKSVLNDEQKVIDKGGFFRKNVFNKFSGCGSSILLLRDHSGIFIERDVHIAGAQLYLDNNQGGSYIQ